MSGREGGKKKPLKAPKKQGGDLDEDDKVSLKSTWRADRYWCFFLPGIPSQAEGRAEEAEGDAGESIKNKIVISRYNGSESNGNPPITDKKRICSFHVNFSIGNRKNPPVEDEMYWCLALTSVIAGFDSLPVITFLFIMATFKKKICPSDWPSKWRRW